jgi:putative membrane protein
LDLVIWAAIGIVSQIVADFLAEVLTPTFSIQKALKEDNVAVAIAMVGMFIAIGLIIAGCLTY